MLNVSSFASAVRLLPPIELLVLKGPGPPIRGWGWFLEVSSKSDSNLQVAVPGEGDGWRGWELQLAAASLSI